jgi:hypothetical protein
MNGSGTFAPKSGKSAAGIAPAATFRLTASLVHAVPWRGRAPKGSRTAAPLKKIRSRRRNRTLRFSSCAFQRHRAVPTSGAMHLYATAYFRHDKTRAVRRQPLTPLPTALFAFTEHETGRGATAPALRWLADSAISGKRPSARRLFGR